MPRWGLVAALLVVGVACVAVWFATHDDPDPALSDLPVEDDTDTTKAPTLEGDAPAPAPKITMAGIDDPIDYVAKFGRPLDETARNAILQLAEAPGFLEALVAWVKDPSVPAPDPGVSQSNRGWWRLGAVHAALEAIGEPAARRLAAELADKDHMVRARVATAIGFIGPKAVVVVPDLIARIDVDESKYVRADLVDALGKIGPGASDALPLIHAALRDEHTEERFGLACARALVPIGGATPEVFDTVREVLRADWYEASAYVIKSLAPLGEDAAPLIPVLVTLYDTPLGEDQLWGVVPNALVEIGVESDEVIVFLRDTFWSGVEQEVSTLHVLSAMARLGPRGQHEVLQITSSDESPWDRLDAVAILQRAGADRARIVALLDPLLNEGDAREQSAALGILRDAGVTSADLPRIEPLLTSTDAEVRINAIEALGAIDAPPKRVFDLLEARLGDTPEVAHTAIWTVGALTRVDPERALALITRALGSSETVVQNAGLNALESASHVAPHEASLLAIEAFDREPPNFSAAHILATTGPETEVVIDALVGMTEHTEPRIRSTGLRGLNRFGKKEHLDVVFKATNDAHHGVRADAILYLATYRQFAPQRVLDRWIEALDDVWVVYARACACLERLGAEAKDAIPKLEQLSTKKVPNRYMASAPEQALKRIRAAVGE